MTSLLLEESVAISLLFLDKKQEANKREQKWFNEAWEQRQLESECCALFKDLTDDETTFHEYFRIRKLSTRDDGKM
jgi:hypothetical protein